MSEQTFLSAPRIAGSLLVLAIVPLGVGITLFISRVGLQGSAPRTPELFILERGSILTAVILTALGLLVLETIFQGSAERTAAHIGAMAYFFGAVLLVVAEAMSMAQNEMSTYPLIVVYEVLVFLGQAAVGGALLLSNLLPAWIGWTSIIWNLGWLIILPITTPNDMYFPVLHHVMPLLIGITLLLRASAMAGN
ncbi:MAG TPA: hypothetical protein VFO91_20920 [Anaerolineales bacterium]|nr:hypothetical protein [Anaerolineales bacterium]